MLQVYDVRCETRSKALFRKNYKNEILLNSAKGQSTVQLDGSKFQICFLSIGNFCEGSNQLSSVVLEIKRKESG